MDRSILVFTTSLVVSVCAVLSAFGFRGRVNTVGIDLGTTYSVVAINEFGKVRVFSDDQNLTLTLSAVGFSTDGITVGREARHAETYIYDAKRFIGRPFVQDHPYPFETVPNGTTTGFKLNPALGFGSSITPEDVGSIIVRRLKQIAEADLGHGVSQAVICVPASFDAAQISATSVAFKRAGLKVARVMPEPVAAACAYGLHKRDVSHVLVYDFGGGTLDVSVLYVQDGSIEVVANGGDNDLGGTDLDQCLASRFQECCTERFALAEGMKIELSHADVVSRDCCGHVTVSRDDFERDCAHIFRRAIDIVLTTLENAMIDISLIDEVVLVGGSSRIPKIRQQLKDALGIHKLNTEIDPDVTVAVGAASILD